jgi:mRNA interferase YafQ
VYSIKTSNKFEKDFVKCTKRNYNLNLLNDALKILEVSGKLPKKYKSHILSGNFDGYWECHIKSDWLLLWRQNDKTRVIELARTGSHSDLFK